MKRLVVMPLLLRFLIVLVLAVIGLFGVMGMLASFEPPGYLGWRIAYGCLILACVAGIVILFLFKKVEKDLR